mmetsp:Transcript_2848/g.4360  ORF Transcript_2848/g.4360 Transcript_2848/m.4360 type:complete len:323 (-) Transcript_2848:115-1083(-)|eukprot:CAMPEP_0174971934 /NCGR_PEP_ID=MMETSP0004_2-20121128/10319_1 /TAXON_ID=420556 /ORGANISM="Ochromonas sp., Strain CCMP1393" /LENGTH=322 /DNA_ID=CAMNT_0016222041 /DNA_START=157 /DNA_END=1125 /DNA_ORIENTATION=+
MLANLFGTTFAKGAVTNLKKKSFTFCDVEEDNEDDTPSLIEQADAAVEDEKSKIKTPMQFENLKNSLMVGNVNSYDGFRVMVQKQINLNTVVSHFYWLGSQVTGQPIYQYRLILPLEDDKLINVASDMDFNLEGEVKVPIAPNVVAKSIFTNGEQQKSLSLELELTDDTSATQFKYSRGAQDQYSIAYMQGVIPNLSIGGCGTYSTKSKSLDAAIGFIYDPAEYTLAAQVDNNIRVLYLRKVNPNRVHLCTDLVVDDTGSAQASVGAEFMLKQSKIQLGIDSNFVIKSYLETHLSPNTQLQLCAETMQLNNHYRFGFGILMG